MRFRLPVILAVASLLCACGGGGGGGSDPGVTDSADVVSITATASTASVPSAANTDLDFVIANPGATTASNVALSVTLGTGLVKAGIQCFSTGAACPTDPLAQQVPTLPPGGSLLFRISVIPQAGASGTIASTATVSATNDAVKSNNSAQLNLTVYSADVSVIGSTNAAEVFGGSNIAYSLLVANAGPDAARNVGLENFLTSGQSMTAMTCDASGGATCPATLGSTMTIPSLPSGGSLMFSVTAQLSMQATVSVNDTLRITSLGDANVANNTATASAAARIPVSPDSPSFMVVHSDSGDYVGQGGSYSYSNENAVFELFPDSGVLSLKVLSDEDWRGFFYMPAGMAQVQTGTYTDQLGAPLHDPATGGFYLGSDSRVCGPHTDWFKVDNVAYAAAGQLASLDIRFEQHCNGVLPALRGQLHWNANDATRPPGPVNPPPTGLWRPAPGSTPASGNYFYVVSDPGDFVGGGRTDTFTQANAILALNKQSTGEPVFSAIGYGSHAITFKAMVPLTRLEPGYYPEVQVWPFGNPARGMMAIGACNGISGWFVIDTITYSGDDVTALDARFEQHCEKVIPALRGQIHWRSDDPTQPPGPQVPPPAGLWAPPPGSVPATGNVVYLQSDRGDFIFNGKTKTYTPLDSVIQVGDIGSTPVGNRFDIAVRGDEQWTGSFQAMSSLSDLRPGYYGNLVGLIINPAIGGLRWSGEGRACDMTGWFVIDSVTYAGNSLDSIELRFEQHCDGGPEALRGLVRWSAADTRQPLPPQVPPPANLWTPPPGATPANGNYVYLQSEAGDFVGQGQTHLFTPGNATIQTSTSGNQFSVQAVPQGQVVPWGGRFVPMFPLTQLQVGYYGNVTRTNIAKGMLDWGGAGRGCGAVSGWFVVDSVTYTGTAVTAIDLRFEQHCENAAAALHGKIRWSQ